jgi:TRAP-type C4-dicarboxylate transport system substrate-binding protein
MSMLQGMGAVPTPVEIAELYTALLTGMVDGQENPITNIHTQRFHEVQTHIMLTSHMVSIPCVFINERVWQSLGPENQRIMADALEEMTRRSVQWVRDEEAPVRREMEQVHGITFIDESGGLRNDLFRQGVNAQISIDFPLWAPLIREIANIR